MATTSNEYRHLRDETARGLRYCHVRINDNTSKALSATAFVYALIEMLIEKKVITVEELDACKRSAGKRLVEQFEKSGLGLMYQDPEIDKYQFEKTADVDCNSITPSCQAVCCKLPIVLSRQDVEEGIIDWDFGRPYMIAHDEAGYCVHLDRESRRCQIRDNRPVPCRGFDCRTSERWPIWEDFDNLVINADLFDLLAENEQKISAGRNGRAGDREAVSHKPRSQDA